MTAILGYTYFMPSEMRFSEVRRMLEKAGWVLTRIRGSHHVFEKSGVGSYPVPVHKGKVEPNYVQKIRKLCQPDHRAD